MCVWMDVLARRKQEKLGEGTQGQAACAGLRAGDWWHERRGDGGRATSWCPSARNRSPRAPSLTNAGRVTFTRCSRAGRRLRQVVRYGGDHDLRIDIPEGDLRPRGGQGLCSAGGA